MKNFVQPGETVTLTAPYDVLSGAGAQVGVMFGVATGDILSTVEGEFVTEGVFDLAKDASAPAQGAAIYWDNTAKLATTTVATNIKIGVAIAAALTGDATARIRLNGSF